MKRQLQATASGKCGLQPRRHEARPDPAGLLLSALLPCPRTTRTEPVPYADPIKRRAANLRAQHKRRGKLPGSAVTPGATVEPEPVDTVAPAPVGTALELAVLTALRARGVRGSDRSALIRLARGQQSHAMQQAVDQLVSRGLVELVPRRTRMWRAVAAAA